MRRLKVLGLVVLTLAVSSCTHVVNGRTEVDWAPTIIGYLLLLAGVIAGSYALGQALRS